MRRRTWIVAVLLVLGAVLLARFGLAFPWAATVDALGDADPLLLAGAGVLNIVSLGAKGGVWYLLLRRMAPLKHATAQSATFVGAAVNSISVAVSGEAARAQMVHDRDAIPYSVAISSLVATRIVEAVGLIVFLVLALAVVQPWPGARLHALILAGVAAIVGLGYHLVPAKRWHPVIAGLAPATGGWWAAPVALAAVNWVAQWLTYHWSIVGTHAAGTPAVSLAALVAANVAGIPRLTPGNIGVMQGSIMLGMRAFGVSPAQGLAAGLALQAVQVLPILAIAVGIVGARGLRQLASRRARTA
ncbi:MAG: lysylphosphatidylglycerol synthase transmembrane domain-containing protein [Gemmatimonadales bacterium]